MAKPIDLLGYWMPVLQGLLEFQEIAGAEEPELGLLLQACERTLNNLFIDTADEYAVGRYEQMMGLVPNQEDTLDARRFKVLNKWNDKIPYTHRVLLSRLLSLCGEGNFAVTERYSEYALDIETSLGAPGAFDEVCSMLVQMLPCNLLVSVHNQRRAQGALPLYFGGAVCVTRVYEITNDISREYQSRQPLYYSGVTAFGQAQRMTNDIAVHSFSQMELYGALGMGVASTERMTQDIHKKSRVPGDAVFAGPVGTGMGIRTTMTERKRENGSISKRGDHKKGTGADG